MDKSSSPPHSSIQCLVAIAQHHGIQVLPDQLVRDYPLDGRTPSTKDMVRMATSIRMQAQPKFIDWQKLTQLEGVFPFIARLVDGSSVIIAGINKTEEKISRVAILDPKGGNSQITLNSEETFCEKWQGEVIFLKRLFSLFDPNQPFSLRWFIPEILKEKTAFRNIAISVLVLQLLALGSPIFFQLVVDRVLTRESYSTLYVLAVGIIIVQLVETIFGFIRQYLLLAATNKIDTRLARKTFSHLLSLPIDYFEGSTAGVIMQRVLQMQSIRGFLTGNLFFIALDATGLFVFLPLMFLYSTKLTLVVLGFSLLMAGVAAALIYPYQRRLSALFTAEATRQAILVEAIHGIRTVKSLTMEPKQRKIWDQRTANSVSLHFSVSKISISAQSITALLEKTMMIAVIALGAMDVFSLQLTVGSLIAFQMISGRVTGPLKQIVGLIHQYQETALSVRMLGEVMNRPPERHSGAGLKPRIIGEIELDNVTFRYPGTTAMALDQVSVKIPPGSVVGIIGKIGSGKTTLTKLIQGLYNAQGGAIRFDGVDMRSIEISHLRRNIGIVLQENFMFRGTIRENIAVTKTDASFEDVVKAAQIAGADEFIERLPQGYDTLLEENGANLSGGQKQRLAIARAILPQPAILILDEAASALDPESEAIFIRNLEKISAGKTVLIVSHRLSTLVNSDKILVFQRGKIVDAGRHKELLARCEHYSSLWNQQTSHL